MYRAWYSTESFAEYIIANTSLRGKSVAKKRMYESDASSPTYFHAMPDHIRKILYLDAPDLIIEKDNEPIFSVEITTEAGTGHNSFQRFARIAASVENSVPAFYIYPEGAIITRKGANPCWDRINPAIFQALESVMSIYDIPALLYYFPTDMDGYLNNPAMAPHFAQRGLQYDADTIHYEGCPDSADAGMQKMFAAIDEVIDSTEKYGIMKGRERLLRTLPIRERRSQMQAEFFAKAAGRTIDNMSPVSAVTVVDTEYLMNYLSQYEDRKYEIGELLRSRKQTVIYQANAHFRGDPYPGVLAAIDYLKCREGKTYEDRRNNLILVFGKVTVDEVNRTIVIANEHNSTITDFFNDVKSSERYNLLTKDYSDLENKDISRYLMQVRYGSAYSKVKHIRVYSYFADAILFPDGSLWRDA